MSFGPHPQTLTLRNWAGGSVAPIDHKMHRLSPGSTKSGFISSFCKLIPAKYLASKREVLASLETDTFVCNGVALFGFRVSMESQKKSRKAHAAWLKHFAGAVVSLRIDKETVVKEVPLKDCSPFRGVDMVFSPLVYHAVDGDTAIGVFMGNGTIATLEARGLPLLKTPYTIRCGFDMATYTSR